MKLQIEVDLDVDCKPMLVAQVLQTIATGILETTANGEVITDLRMKKNGVLYGGRVMIGADKESAEVFCNHNVVDEPMIDREVREAAMVQENNEPAQHVGLRRHILTKGGSGFAIEDPSWYAVEHMVRPNGTGEYDLLPRYTGADLLEALRVHFEKENAKNKH